MAQVDCQVCGRSFDGSCWECPNCGAPAPLGSHARLVRRLGSGGAAIGAFVCMTLSTSLSAMQVEQPTQVMSFAQVQQATAVSGQAANIDASLSTYISSDGNRYWQIPYNYNGGVYLATSRSPAGNAYNDLLGTATTQAGQWDLFSNYSNFPGRWWVVSSLQLNANPVELISFIHAECLDVPCTSAQTQRSGIGVAYFKQGENNNKYRYMGLVVTPYGDPANFNIQGAPFLISGDYLQFYYSDRDSSDGSPSVAVARTYLPDLIAAARSGNSSPHWQKYSSGNWQQPGLGGAFSALGNASNGIPGWHITHSGAAYSTYAKKYYLTTYVNADQPPAFPGWPQGNGVFLFESSDSINWTFKTTLYWAGVTAASPNPPPAHTPGFEYVTITSTDPGAWSYGTVASTFYVYAPFDMGSGDSKMGVYRTKVTLEPSDCAGGTGYCGAP